MLHVFAQVARELSGFTLCAWPPATGIVSVLLEVMLHSVAAGDWRGAGAASGQSSATGDRKVEALSSRQQARTMGRLSTIVETLSFLLLFYARLTSLSGFRRRQGQESSGRRWCAGCLPSRLRCHVGRGHLRHFWLWTHIVGNSPAQ